MRPVEPGVRSASSADAIVVGLGTMGIAAAYELTARGLRVVGLDRFAPPHGRGAHAGESRMFRTAYMEGAAYVPLVVESLRRWQEIEKAAQVDLITSTGALMLGRPESVAVGGALATARSYGLRHELLDPAEVRRRFPAFMPADDEVGLWEEAAGFVRPEPAITAMAELARHHGADLRTGVAVSGWTAGRDGVTVHCGAEKIDAGLLVLAPGAWAPSLVRLPVPFRVERRIQHFWRPAEPSLAEPARMPVWLWESGDEQAYGMPAIDGRVKAALHHHGVVHERVDPDVGAAGATPQDVAAMRGWLATRIPSLAEGGWLDAKPCLYTLTPDEHFILGRHPDHATVTVACGFSGHGFKFAPLVGAILADLVTTGRTAHDISMFDPSRFA